ncbi:CocE/NonD family hydrolase [Gemmatimonas sp.]|uniref:CocE/NonD family hydrolase n=1 Tax=Gemmatimonas sp. TaxID=1962908 RepID=UPI00286DAE39|nr:CocE/NonD family hydrolase [Gemmatimonas sp.]
MRRVFRRVLTCAAWSWLAPAAQLTAQGDAAPVADSTYARAHYVKRVMLAPMRDGARLMTVAYVPRDASPTRRYPIVLQRTPFSVGPYDSTTITSTLAPDAFMLRDGYIFVAQEVRGRYRSEGTFENMRPLRAPQGRAAVDEATDAYDTIAWLLTHLEGDDVRVHHLRSLARERRGVARAVATRSAPVARCSSCT